MGKNTTEVNRVLGSCSQEARDGHMAHHGGCFFFFPPHLLFFSMVVQASLKLKAILSPLLPFPSAVMTEMSLQVQMMLIKKKKF